jgi:hypothetical protein
MMAFLLVVSCVVLLLVCVLGAGYFLVVVPRRWREPLRLALARLDLTGSEDLEETDRLLSQVMDAGPRGRDLADARFAQAFVRALLGGHDPDRFWAAAGAVEALAAAGGHDASTAHLHMWLQYRLDHHDQVTDYYQEHAELLADRPRSRRIAAASHLHLAGTHWQRREPDAALHHFDRVREMDELTEHIPKAAENLHVLKGIQSVLDLRLEDARAAFVRARTRAERQGGSTVDAELGLLACDWPKAAPSELGERLGRIAAELSKEDGDLEDGELEYRKLLRPPVALLHLVAFLREKERAPRSGGLDTAEWEEFARRVDAVHSADPELGDGYLIAGLLGYYFALNERERDGALTTLETGMRVAKGIVVPEVQQLVEKERALGGQGDALSRYLQLVSELLTDPAVSPQDRDEYRRLRDRFALYADSESVAGFEPYRRTSARDLGQRMGALRRRIELIAYPRIRDLPDEDPAVREFQERLGELDDVVTMYTERDEVLHRTEHKIITMTGEFLLPQEEETKEGHARDHTDGADRP